jgi:hypothetical protein
MWVSWDEANVGTVTAGSQFHSLLAWRAFLIRVYNNPEITFLSTIGVVVVQEIEQATGG